MPRKRPEPPESATIASLTNIPEWAITVAHAGPKHQLLGLIQNGRLIHIDEGQAEQLIRHIDVFLWERRNERQEAERKAERERKASMKRCFHQRTEL